MSNVSPVESEKLKKLAPAPTIPIDQLRAQIASFRHINTDKNQSWIYIVGGGSGSINTDKNNTDKNKSWIYIVGGGSGSGLILLLIICGCLYWRYKNPQHSGARSPSHVTYTDSENQNMMHTREDAIRSHKGSDLGLKTVRFQEPVGDMGKVIDWNQWGIWER